MYVAYRYPLRRGTYSSLAWLGRNTRQPATKCRSYATQSPAKRKQITVVSDDGRIPWSDLSIKEKVSRSTQQSFNLAFILIGTAMTGLVVYVLVQDVFSAESKTSYFNRAVSKIKKSEACVQALGAAESMTFYGESIRSSFRRGREAGPTPIAQSYRDERTGVDTIKMQFKVQGHLASGWAVMHLEKAINETEYHYVLLAVDVPGHGRIYLEGHPKSRARAAPGRGTKFFGLLS